MSLIHCILFFGGGGGVELSLLLLRPVLAYCTSPPMMMDDYDCGAVSVECLAEETEVLGGNLLCLPLCLPQIPQDLTWARDMPPR
jgi:hypothetical protein